MGICLGPYEVLGEGGFSFKRGTPAAHRVGEVRTPPLDIYIYIYIYICIYTYVYIYLYIYIYVHIYI